MGLIISVYRDADGHDCTNNGVSSKFTSLTVINAEGPFDPTPDRPAVMLNNHYQKCVRLVPVDDNGVARLGAMFGGNYGVTSDTRFREAIEKMIGQQWYGAVAIHDRFE